MLSGFVKPQSGWVTKIFRRIPGNERITQWPRVPGRRGDMLLCEIAIGQLANHVEKGKWGGGITAFAKGIGLKRPTVEVWMKATATSELAERSANLGTSKVATIERAPEPEEMWACVVVSCAANKMLAEKTISTHLPQKYKDQLQSERRKGDPVEVPSTKTMKKADTILSETTNAVLSTPMAEEKKADIALS